MISEFCVIGSDEIQNIVVREGARLHKSGTNITGVLKFGKDAKTGKKTNLIGAVKTVDGRVYLASLDGELLNGWEVVS